MTEEHIATVALRAMGNWNATTKYPQLALVRNGSALYIATAPNKGVQPGVASTSASFWMLACEDGENLDDAYVDDVHQDENGHTITNVVLEGDKGFSSDIDIYAQDGAENFTVTETTFTLHANAWEGNGTPYSQKVQIGAVTADSVNFITAPIGVTESQLSTIYSAVLGDGGQKNGEITVLCYGDVPATDMTLKITVFDN